MRKVINIPYTVESNEYELGGIIIYGKRVISFISKNGIFPGALTLYNWHELCCITKVYFLSKSDVAASVTGIALCGGNLLIQINEKSYPRHIQASTPCPRWILEKYTEFSR
jgi:hypothetical protein